MVTKLRIKLKKFPKAAVRKRWNLERMILDDDTARNYRCEIAVVVEKRESADQNGRREHFKSTVIKAT